MGWCPRGGTGRVAVPFAPDSCEHECPRSDPLEAAAWDPAAGSVLARVAVRRPVPLEPQPPDLV